MTYRYLGAVLVYVPAPRGGEMTNTPRQQSDFASSSPRAIVSRECACPRIRPGFLCFRPFWTPLLCFQGSPLPFSAPFLAAIRLFVRPVFVWKHRFSLPGRIPLAAIALHADPPLFRRACVRLAARRLDAGVCLRLAGLVPGVAGWCAAAHRGGGRGGGHLCRRLPALAGQRFAGFVGGLGHVAFIFAGRCRAAVAPLASRRRVGLSAPESPVGVHGRV